MLSAGTTNQSRFDGQPQGLATDAIEAIEVLTDNFSGVFSTRTDTANERLRRLEDDLATLTERTELIYQRYLTQFTAMETLVSQLNNTRESLTSSWDNLGLYKD